MQSKKPMISIIIPIYNAKSYVPRCLDSIIKQDFADWEAVIVNDGSTDGIEEVFDYYANKDSRIKTISIKNAGVSNARNVGILNAQGDYIYFLDVDDWLQNNTLSLLKDASADGFDIVQGAYDVVYEDGSVTNDVKFYNKELSGYNAILSEYLLGNIKQSVWNKLIKAQMIKGITFDTDLAVAEDTKFVYELCKVCSNVKLIDTVTYHYFVRNDSCMNESLSEKHFQGLKVVDIQLSETKANKELYSKCVRKEAILCLDLIHAINDEKKYTDKLPELRNRVVSKLYYILTSKHFSLKFKAGVILLYFCPSLFYKMFSK